MPDPANGVNPAEFRRHFNTKTQRSHEGHKSERQNLERFGDRKTGYNPFMMRFLLILAAAAGTAFALQPKKPADPLTEARARLQHGNYAEARETYEALLKDPKLAPRAAVGLAECFRAEGDNAEALAALEDALKATPDDPDLRAHRADLLFSLGQWDDAKKDADAVLSKNEKHFLARWVRARLLRDSGDVAAADKEVRWFVREYSDAENADKPITDSERLLIVGQAGAENALWNNRPQQFNFILNEIYRDALKHDPDCWQAENLAGRMLLEKHNRADALDAFDKALKINPKAAEALVGKGLVALDSFDLKDSENYAEQALKVNPKHPEALRLKADVLIAGGDLASAERLLTAAKLINPRDEVTLARLAACYYLMNRPDDVRQLSKEAESFDTRPAVFYQEFAGVLEGRKQYAKAEEYYRNAAELRPMLPASKAGLGLLLMRTGSEGEARKTLESALKADPFNVRVSNSLKVLKHLDGYQTIETDHYVVKFDPKTDKIMAQFLAEYLEAGHAELKKQFSYEPPGKVLIEVFSTREMFSGRTIALPSLPDAAAGACTGRVISFPSPKAEGARPFNWARVVRHEQTHAFNLLQTDYRVPHWLTEGLAVRSEGGARPPAWLTVLRERHAAGKLLDLDNITLAFVRPRTEDDWPLAYLQALLYVEYTTKTHGEGAIAKLLDAYRAGGSTAAVLKSALGVDKAEFEAGYRKYLEEVVKEAGPRRRTEKPMTFAELEAAYKKSPDDADLMAKLAAEYVRRNKPMEAKKLADAAIAKEKGHALASIVKARLLSRDKDDAAAKGVLEEAAKENPDDPRVQLALGKLCIELKDLAGAAQAFEKGRQVAPLDGDWLTELARIYTAMKNDAALIAVLREVTARDPDDLAARVKLARLLIKEKPAEAERFARESLFIDVMNEDGRELLVESLRAQKKDAEAAAIAKRFE
jgi:tetratricopeptide (TPR) repeat protein